MVVIKIKNYFYFVNCITLIVLGDLLILFKKYLHNIIVNDMPYAF